MRRLQGLTRLICSSPYPVAWATFSTVSRDAARLHDRLIDEHAIEVPVLARDASLWVRISAQVYNEFEDYARLAQAVAKIR